MLLFESGLHGNKCLNVFEVILLVQIRLNGNNKIEKPNCRFDTIRLVWFII